MIKEQLNFRIELVDKSNEELSDKFARDFVHSLGLKTFSGTWSTIELDSHVINEFVNKAKTLLLNKLGRFNGFSSLVQYIQEEDNETIDWYELRSDKSMAIVDYGEIITCKADKMSPNVHIASGWSYNIFVSEKFKRVVETSGLTGLDFVWLKDIGKFQAPQWFLPVILKPLGRGIDHPWFDINTLRGPNSFQPTDSKFRHGINQFRAGQIKKDINIDSLHRDIINFFDPEMLSIVSFHRFLRDFTPNTDFAFTWKEGDRDRKSDGLFLQDRVLCISKKAKDILLQNKLIEKNNINPIEIIDEPAEKTRILDGKGEFPTPFYSYAHVELSSLKNKLEHQWEEFNKVVKPDKVISINQAIKLLIEAKRNRPDDFQKPLAKTEVSIDIVGSLPAYWIEILKKSNGCEINSECVLVPLQQLEQFGKEKEKWCRGVEEEFPINLIPIGYVGDGDWYSLETRPSSTQDAKVKRISHETCHPIDEWNSIADFIYDMLYSYHNL